MGYFGKMFYSKYFGCWCVVVAYKDDRNWWFVPERNPRILKARTPFYKIFGTKEYDEHA